MWRRWGRRFMFCEVVELLVLFFRLFCCMKMNHEKKKKNRLFVVLFSGFFFAKYHQKQFSFFKSFIFLSIFPFPPLFYLCIFKCSLTSFTNCSRTFAGNFAVAKIVTETSWDFVYS